MANLKFKRFDSARVDIYFVCGRKDGKDMLDYVYSCNTIARAEKEIRSAFENNGNMVFCQYQIFVSETPILSYTLTDENEIEVHGL